jgi:hypothetical protein
MGTAVNPRKGRSAVFDSPRRAALRRRLDVALERVREIYGARRCLLLTLDGRASRAP